MGGRAALTGVDLHVAPAAWLWLACIALISTVLAMLTFFAGLRRTGPSATAILSTFEPVVTVGLAAVVLGESLTWVQGLGGAFVLASVVVLQLRRSGEAPEVGLAPLVVEDAEDLGGPAVGAERVGHHG